MGDPLGDPPGDTHGDSPGDTPGETPGETQGGTSGGYPSMSPGVSPRMPRGILRGGARMYKCILPLLVARRPPPEHASIHPRGFSGSPRGSLWGPPQGDSYCSVCQIRAA